MGDTPRTDNRERVAKLRCSGAVMGVIPAVFARELERENAELRKLVEQMREALKKALQSADAEWENKNLGHDWLEACEAVRAALEAAERGK